MRKRSEGKKRKRIRNVREDEMIAAAVVTAVVVAMIVAKILEVVVDVREENTRRVVFDCSRIHQKLTLSQISVTPRSTKKLVQILTLDEPCEDETYKNRDQRSDLLCMA